MIGLHEIEATQETIRELRRAGNEERAAAVSAVLAAATVTLTSRRGEQPRPFLTTGEAARALGVSIQTVKNWAAAGRLQLVQLGGRNVLRREDLLVYLDSLRARPRSPGPFDGAGIDEERVRARLPADLVARIDAHHAAIENGDVLTPEDEAELGRLEHTATSLAGHHLKKAARRPGR